MWSMKSHLHVFFIVTYVSNTSLMAYSEKNNFFKWLDSKLVTSTSQIWSNISRCLKFSRFFTHPPKNFRAPLPIEKSCPLQTPSSYLDRWSEGLLVRRSWGSDRGRGDENSGVFTREATHGFNHSYRGCSFFNLHTLLEYFLFKREVVIRRDRPAG